LQLIERRQQKSHHSLTIRLRSTVKAERFSNQNFGILNVIHDGVGFLAHSVSPVAALWRGRAKPMVLPSGCSAFRGLLFDSADSLSNDLYQPN
jgi:hypothetical protein